MVLVTRTRRLAGQRQRDGDRARRDGAGRPDFKPTTTTVPLRRRGHLAAAGRGPAPRGQAGRAGRDVHRVLGHARCGGLGARHRATVTIVDDDQGVPSNAPPPSPRRRRDGRGALDGAGGPASAPAPRFTIGGTVDGLQGSGSCSRTSARSCRSPANGRFTFPGTRGAGQSYEVAVRTQPQQPRPGLHRGARRRDRGQRRRDRHRRALRDARHAAGPRPHVRHRRPRLDARRQRPRRGGRHPARRRHRHRRLARHGRQQRDFALTRHDPAGNLDPTLRRRTGSPPPTWAATTTRPRTRRRTPDGGIVAVGRTDKAGTQNTDFALVRYLPDGMPDPGFGTGGIVTTDVLAGHAAQANAVAVQPDGKIVVAGFAAAPPRHRHRLRARALQRRREPGHDVRRPTAS